MEFTPQWYRVFIGHRSSHMQIIHLMLNNVDETAKFVTGFQVLVEQELNAGSKLRMRFFIFIFNVTRPFRSLQPLQDMSVCDLRGGGFAQSL